MALPRGATGSLRPAFAPARLVRLAVKLPYAFALYGWFPISLREPLHASVTLWEATAPVKLPTTQCPRPGSRAWVRSTAQQGWYFNDGSTETGVPASQPPTYAIHPQSTSSPRIQSSSTGSFRLVAGNPHLHGYYNFTESPVETAPKSLRHSCRSELTRQGISLP